MADGSTLVAPAGSGDSIDEEVLTGGTRRQRVEVAGALLAEVARVENANPAVTDYGLIVRPIVAKGALAAPSAVSVTTSSTQLLAANTARDVAMFRNNGTQDVAIGITGVTFAAGFILKPGEVFTDEASNTAWYAIVAAGTAEVRVLEIA